MYELSEQIGASRTDNTGKLRLVSAIDILQDCSMLWLQSEPTFSNCLDDNGWFMIMASRQVNVERLPNYLESVTVKTWIYECQKSLGYRNTVMFDERGEVCVSSWCIGAFVDREKGKFIKLPLEVIESLSIDEKFDMEYLPKKIKAADTYSVSPQIPLRRSDIDINNHVNNARYVEMACEVLPEDFAPRRMRVEYKKAAVWGDAIYPHRALISDEICQVKLADALDNPYAVVEFAR